MTSVRLPPGSPQQGARSEAPGGRPPAQRQRIQGVPASPPPRGPRTPGDVLRDFVRRHGWRAYALPVLIVVTIVALVQGGDPAPMDTAATAPPAAGSPGEPAPGATPTPAASAQETVKVDQSGANVLAGPLDYAALPPGEAYTEQGTGTFSVIPGSTAVAGTGPLRRYAIEAEDGVAGIDLQAMAATIDATLADPRSWTAGGRFSLQRVDSGPVDFRITLASSLTVRSLCGYEEQIETSCWAPDQDERVVVNNARWVRGAVAYANDLATYRTYLINHEVGHALGFGHEFSCLADGKAPLMMQQTKSIVDVNGATCQPNPWPNP